MQILKETCIDWRERRLISKLYMDQKVKVRLDQEETRSVKIERGDKPGRCLSLIRFNVYSEYLNKKAFEVFGGIKIRG
jgi:hypothetical protein